MYPLQQVRNWFIGDYISKTDRSKTVFGTTLEKWKGSHEQVDDILLMGIKF